MEYKYGKYQNVNQETRWASAEELKNALSVETPEVVVGVESSRPKTKGKAYIIAALAALCMMVLLGGWLLFDRSSENTDIEQADTEVIDANENAPGNADSEKEDLVKEEETETEKGVDSEEHAVTTEDLFDLALGNPIAEDDSATVAFQLNGTTYYMGVGEHGQTYPHSASYIGTPISEGGVRRMDFDISFYTSPGGEEFVRITDEDILKEIQQAFGETLKLELKGLDYSGIEVEPPEIFPEILRNQENADCYKI